MDNLVVPLFEKNNFIESTLCLQSKSGHIFFQNLKSLVVTSEPKINFKFSKIGISVTTTEYLLDRAKNETQHCVY